jgi:hypothetical protein
MNTIKPEHHTWPTRHPTGDDSPGKSTLPELLDEIEKTEEYGDHVICRQVGDTWVIRIWRAPRH